MKISIETDRTDKVLEKVCNALTRYAPDEVEFASPEDADLVVLHVIGRRDKVMRSVEAMQAAGQKYAVIQYSVKSTQKPQTSDWIRLWRGAQLVWSYLPLDDWCLMEWTPRDFNFYKAPLGVDPSVFYPRPRERKFTIGTCGPSALIESVREAALATQAVDGHMFHLGPELNREGVTCYSDIEDDYLASLLSECQFVSGLRRTEGFELMAAEGLFCGARPILFWKGHYTQWYEHWGVFIKEGSREKVVEDLVKVFREGTKPILEERFLMAKEWFNWETIIGGFWDRCLTSAF